MTIMKLMKYPIAVYIFLGLFVVASILQLAFAFIENQYYFDEYKQVFSPCYRDCLQCDKKEINSKHMNCKKCHKMYKLYENSTNCLKCRKYVNYEQTECIDQIPKGYFLANESYGLIDKCHELCETCQGRPQIVDGKVHMNCKTCLYKSTKTELINGNCPDHPDDTTEKVEEDDESIIAGNNYVIIFIVTIIVVLILNIIIVMCLLKKCKCKKKEEPVIRHTDYYNIGGKNIPLDEEEINAVIN